MTTIASVTLEVSGVAAAEAFYADAFDLDDTVGVRASDAPTSGFRGFTMSLVVSQLCSRRAAAKDAGVSPDGNGSHLMVVGSDAGPFSDPDGFDWEAA